MLRELLARRGRRARARTDVPPWLRERDPGEVAGERAAQLCTRARGFLDAVRR